jgi:ABC-type sugar transport system ATPase subunit
MKMIAGSVSASSGRLFIDGMERTIWSRVVARAGGTVYQDLSLCDNLNVYENVLLGCEGKMRRGGVPILDHAARRKQTHEVPARGACRERQPDADGSDRASAVARYDRDAGQPSVS